MTSKRVNRKASRRIASGTCAASGNVHHTCMRASPQCRNSRASAAHPCTAPCARRCRPTTQCDSRTGFKLPSVVQPCIRFGNDPCIRNNNWQRLCTPLPPEPSQQTAQLPRTAAAHSRRRRHRQPCASYAHPCIALCTRRRGVAYRLNLEQVSLCHSSCTTPAAIRALNDPPWPASVPTIAARSLHRNAPSGQQPVTHRASDQTTGVRTTRAPVGAPGCATLACPQSRNCNT